MAHLVNFSFQFLDLGAGGFNLDLKRITLNSFFLRLELVLRQFEVASFNLSQHHLQLHQLLLSLPNLVAIRVEVGKGRQASYGLVTAEVPFARLWPFDFLGDAFVLRLHVCELLGTHEQLPGLFPQTSKHLQLGLQFSTFLLGQRILLFVFLRSFPECLLLGTVLLLQGLQFALHSFLVLLVTVPPRFGLFERCLQFLGFGFEVPDALEVLRVEGLQAAQF